MYGGVDARTKTASTFNKETIELKKLEEDEEFLMAKLAL